jgi:hypothetical protein
MQKVQLREITKKAVFKFNQQLFAWQLKAKKTRKKEKYKDKQNLYKTSSRGDKFNTSLRNRKRLKDYFIDENLQIEGKAGDEPVAIDTKKKPRGKQVCSDKKDSRFAGRNLHDRDGEEYSVIQDNSAESDYRIEED